MIQLFIKQFVIKLFVWFHNWVDTPNCFIPIIGVSAVASIVLLVLFLNSFSHPLSNSNFSSNQYQNHQSAIPVANGYSFLKKWGDDNFTGNGQLRTLGGVSVDSSGNVYVADQGNSRVQKFDSNGNFITQWGKSGSENGNFSIPAVVAVDSDDYVYVTDWGNNRVQKFDNNGHYITEWGIFEWDNGSFNHPEGIVIDPKTQYVYVTEKTNNRVQVFFPFSYISK